MRAQPIAIVPQAEEQEEMYFLLIPQSTYARVVEEAAKQNLTVQQLIQKGLEYVTRR